jgi:sensor domain CHASE-containing protein
MLLSRFWYIVLSLTLGVLVFVLFVAQSLYNRNAAKDVAEGLQSDAQVVSWYLKNDARERSAQMIKFTLDDTISKNLAKSSGSDGSVPSKVREAVKKGLEKVAASIDKESQFDAVFAVDQHGRVVAHLGYEQASGLDDFELGGYPVVADALHGYIRDDTLVLDRLYRVVARPVEYDLGQMPAGAIIGARIVDDRFARELSQRTGAAIAFYAEGQRVASGAPEDFERSQLDMIINDLEVAEKDPDYKEKGRSSVRTLGKTVGVVYTRLPGEAWELGAGYVVGRVARAVQTPLAFFSAADDKDNSTANIPLVVGLVLLAGGLGILFTFLEHSRPLRAFRDEARRLAKGEVDQLSPSKFGGAYRAVASDVNDGLDTAVGKAGGNRRAADLQQVLGELPAEPQMSAFSFPGDTATAPPATPSSGAQPAGPSRPGNPLPSAPKNRLAAELRQKGETPPASGPDSAGAAQGEDPEWPRIYDEFVSTKNQCGESTDGFTFDKFKNTLRKNRDAIIQRHGVRRVKFSVYVKDGKAALKASPIKD